MASATNSMDDYLHASWLRWAKSYRKICVACSGGLDSTALFHGICRLHKKVGDLELAISHVNYGLRGQESVDDERFVGNLAAESRAKFFCHRVSKGPQKENIQAWARKIRYREFHRIAQSGWLIVLAHHQSDVAESVILRLSRGVSAQHIVGMKEFSSPFWRPLLCTPHRLIEEWAHRHNLPYRTDSSNAMMIYSRNVIRHQILPRLESLHPGASSRIALSGFEIADLARTGEVNLKEDTLRIQDLCDKPRYLQLQSLASFIKAQLGEHIQLSRRLLNTVAKLAGPTGSPGKALSLPGGKHVLLRDCRGGLRVKTASSFNRSRFFQHRKNFLPPQSYVLLSGTAEATLACERWGAVQMLASTRCELACRLRGAVRKSESDIQFNFSSFNFLSRKQAGYSSGKLNIALLFWENKIEYHGH